MGKTETVREGRSVDVEERKPDGFGEKFVDFYRKLKSGDLNDVLVAMQTVGELGNGLMRFFDGIESNSVNELFPKDEFLVEDLKNWSVDIRKSGEDLVSMRLIVSGNSFDNPNVISRVTLVIGEIENLVGITLTKGKGKMRMKIWSGENKEGAEGGFWMWKPIEEENTWREPEAVSWIEGNGRV